MIIYFEDVLPKVENEDLLIRILALISIWIGKKQEAHGDEVVLKFHQIMFEIKIVKQIFGIIK